MREKTMAFTSFTMLPVAGHHLLVADALSVWRRTDNIKSMAQSRHGSASRHFVAAPYVLGATSGVVNSELSCRSHLRPDGSTSASRCSVHRTWNQRLRLSVFQYLSTSWPTQGQFHCLIQLPAFEFFVHHHIQIFACTQTRWVVLPWSYIDIICRTMCKFCMQYVRCMNLFCTFSYSDWHAVLDISYLSFCYGSV